MAQSLSNVVVHAVFSTHQRAPSLTPEIRPRLYAYIVGTINADGSRAIRIGGFDDHVHMLFALGKIRSISDTMKVVKAASSKWLKTQAPHLKDFAWQSGYASFSVGRNEIAEVERYISNQEVHHSARTFQDELRALLAAQEIDFDERFLWD